MAVRFKQAGSGRVHGVDVVKPLKVVSLLSEIEAHIGLLKDEAGNPTPRFKEILEQGKKLSYQLREEMRRLEVAAGIYQPKKRGPKPYLSSHLLPSELRIAEHVIQGKTNLEIALELNFQPRTVMTHVANIYHKCGVKNQMELIRLYKTEGLPLPTKAEKRETPKPKVVSDEVVLPQGLIKQSA